MKELNMMEVESVNGGSFWTPVLQGILASGAYEALKHAGDYLLKNSHMGKGNFPSVPRAGHE